MQRERAAELGYVDSNHLTRVGDESPTGESRPAALPRSLPEGSRRSAAALESWRTRGAALVDAGRAPGEAGNRSRLISGRSCRPRRCRQVGRPGQGPLVADVGLILPLVPVPAGRSAWRAAAPRSMSNRPRCLCPCRRVGRRGRQPLTSEDGPILSPRVNSSASASGGISLNGGMVCKSAGFRRYWCCGVALFRVEAVSPGVPGRGCTIGGSTRAGAGTFAFSTEGDLNEASCS